MARGSKNEPYESTVQGAFDDAKDEIGALATEMEDWKANLESSEMDHLPKYEEVSEAVDGLDSVVGSLDAIDLSELGSEIEDLSVTTTQDTRKKAASRASRAGNAMTLLEAAKEVLEEFADAGQEATSALATAVGNLEGMLPKSERVATLTEHRDWLDECSTQAKDAADEIDNALDDLETVLFPGMY